VPGSVSVSHSGVYPSFCQLMMLPIGDFLLVASIRGTFIAIVATAISSPRKLNTDDVFFPAMGVLILGFVLLGFWQSYFSAGLVRANLPNTLVHIHGALFVTWIFFLLLQTSLVAIGRVKWHTTLGIAGVILPPLMVVFGILTLFDSIRRNGTQFAPGLILVGDAANLLLFAVLTGWGVLMRRNPAYHKRLMILGTTAILGPAIDRWPIPHTLGITIAAIFGLPLLVIAYDLWSTHRVHRGTAIAFTMIAVVILSIVPVSHLQMWQHAVAWIRRT
jgi:hypothetical protein